jgi:hypothetical protein
MLTQGYAAPQVGRAFARARELCERVGETPQTFPRAAGSSGSSTSSGAELSVARSIAEQLEQLAERAADPWARARSGPCARRDVVLLG